MKSNSPKDFIEFLLINLIFVDNSLMTFLGILIYVELYLLYGEPIANIFLSHGSVIYALVIFLKIFVLLIYYETDYKRVKSPLVINFIEKLITNTKFRFVFLIILFIPYLILLVIGNTGSIFSGHYWQEFFKGFIVFFPACGVLSYLSFYIYIDFKIYIAQLTLKNKINLKNIISFIKYKYLKLFIFVILGLFFYSINNIYDLIPYKNIGINRYKDLQTVCSDKISVSNIPKVGAFNEQDIFNYKLYFGYDDEDFLHIDENDSWDLLSFLGDKVQKDNNVSYKKGNVYYDYKNELIMIEQYESKNNINYACRYTKDGSLVSKRFVDGETVYIFNKNNDYVYQHTSTPFGEIVYKKKHNYIN